MLLTNSKLYFILSGEFRDELCDICAAEMQHILCDLQLFILGLPGFPRWGGRPVSSFGLQREHAGAPGAIPGHSGIS